MTTQVDPKDSNVNKTPTSVDIPNPNVNSLPSSRPMTLNEKYGLTEIYHCDFDDKTGVCKKCHKPPTPGALKLCAVIGKEEVARFRDYDER